MAASRQDISRWFEAGKARKCTHFIVVCDTFDHEDYPIYTTGPEETWKQYTEHQGINMQRVMEVYDLSADKESQMNEHRAMRLPEKP